MNASADTHQLTHRLATQTDMDDIYDLFMDEASNPYLTYDPMDKKDFDRIFQEVLSTKTVYVVESDRRVVATYRLIPKTDRQAHTIYLGSFAVSHVRKSKGIGTQIVEHIKKSASEKGRKRIELTVDVENHPAINLYKKTGFAIEGHIRNSYKRSSSNQYYDEYLMAVLI